MNETLIERSDGLVTVTFNRPRKKNAVNAANWADLDAVLREVARNPGGQGAAADRGRRRAVADELSEEGQP